MCPMQIHILRPNAQCEDIWRRAFGSWPGHEEPLWMRSMPWGKSLQRVPQSLWPPEGPGRSWPSVTRNQPFARYRAHQCLDLGLSNLQNCKKYMFKSPGLCIFVRAAPADWGGGPHRDSRLMVTPRVWLSLCKLPFTWRERICPLSLESVFLTTLNPLWLFLIIAP